MKLLEEITRNLAAKYEIAYEDILQSSESKEDQEYMLKMLNKERAREELEEQEKLVRLNQEQWEVLSLCLSLPQTQVVVYETHSMKTSENKELVENAVNAANSAATANFKKYMEEKNVIQKGDEEAEDRGEAAKEATDVINIDEGNQAESETPVIDHTIPLTDLFEIEDIPSIKETSKEDGCSISLIRRKEFVLLNNRYLIQMAEARGLFGTKVEDKNRSPSESAKGSKQKKKARTYSEDSDYSGEFGHRPPRNKELEIERISAPTVASLRRSRKWSTKRTFKKSDKEDGEHSSDDDYEKYVCGRCASRGEDECHHTLKMEGGRLIHPDKYIELSRKNSSQKNIRSTSKKNLMCRLVVPTKVSLLRQNITWKEYKARLEEAMLSRQLGNPSLNSSQYAVGSVNKRSKTDIFKRHATLNDSYAPSSWNTVSDNTFNVKARNETFSIQAVDKAILSNSENFSLRTPRGLRDSLRKIHEAVQPKKTDDLSEEWVYGHTLCVTPQASRESLVSASMQRNGNEKWQRNDSRVDIIFQMKDSQKTASSERMNPREMQAQTVESDHKHEYHEVQRVPSFQSEVSKPLKITSQGSYEKEIYEDNNSMNSQVDWRKEKDDEGPHYLKRTVVEFIYPYPKSPI
ncbi:uncharacterized protein LOC124165864 [Ischnura elegans]|uniref:uncharacterized protein LOC124165864 n=1 Tax=Ischnura elegans TaxID=197161 RepID=UPI001ED8AE75|nr:uncharacterized protein LOC124165864 [Ischnura elegans]